MIRLRTLLAAAVVVALCRPVAAEDANPPHAAPQASAAIQRLQDDQHLTLSQRQVLLNTIAASADEIISDAGHDPQLLFDRGQLLARQGVDPETGILEYWGDTDVGKQNLRTLAMAAVKVFDRAYVLASADANDLANKITSPSDPTAEQWQKTSDLAGAAQYQEARMQCALALGMDPANTQRRSLIDQVAKTLGRWDNPESGIQPQVRFLQAKLQVLRKPGDISQAGQTLDTLIENPGNKIVPAPTPQLVFEARCYKVVAELGAGDLQMAKTALASARADQKAHFANDRVQAATLRLLDYRILAAQADSTPEGPDHADANAAALTALGRLIQDFPSLRDVIYQQLAARLPADSSLAQLGPLLLGALVEQGRQQVMGEETGDAHNLAITQRALAAANELLARFRAGKIPADQAVEASFLCGVFQEVLGDKTAAADSLLNHAERFANDPNSNANFALDRAAVLIGQVRQSNPGDAAIAKLQQRFLPLAVNPPFNRKEFALQYAASLFGQNQWDAAAKYYRLAANTADRQQSLSAQYGEMMSLKNKLENTPSLSNSDQRILESNIQQLADGIAPVANSIMQHSNSDQEKIRARAALARTLLVAADMARRPPEDAGRILKLLGGFEASVRDLPESDSLLAGALFLRVQAYVDLGREDDATRTLVQYLNSTSGIEGAQAVHDLLAKLNDELDEAKAKSDMGKVRRIATDRAALSGFLIKWAQSSTDPKIHRYTYIYARYDADAKRLAATLEAKPADRQRDLAGALRLYRGLQSPENVALYQATFDANSQIDKAYPDPLVSLGIGLIAYDLGDCQTVKATLGPLIQDEKLGENNDQCWEATYKLLDCMHTLAQKSDPNTTDAQVQQSLKILYLIWRDGTGGAKWHEQFESLRRQLLPNWSPPPAQSSQ